GLIALRLADDEIIPFNYVSYASELEESSKVVEDGCPGCAVSFSPLHKSIKQLEKAAMKIHMEKKVCEQKSHWKAAFTEISSYKTCTFLMMIGAASR
uniref:Uncharacterized protein n=1 Tax=Aegilops tauschii subsp. strangulata TaxID=200361 RepID=A0A453FFY4_AEGTS